ncbi:MAG: hypothetical protein QNJ18_22660 [Xenococcaceae cyanobacterium MO_167.B52]|nr:hypothetical protein [Xenococcaceae cyanobacterium MO_167.B52]
MLWLCKVKKIWELTITILSSNVIQGIIALKSDKVQAFGHISDFSSYFLSHWVFISPLR